MDKAEEVQAEIVAPKNGRKPKAEIVKAESELPVAQNFIDYLIEKNASIEQMEKLFAFHQKVEADRAKKEFDQAFAAFKSEAIKIVKNVTYKDGPLKGKKHADLFGIVDAVTPALSKHGLSMSWKLTKDEPQWIEVTCILRHEQGHSESVSMGAGPDMGPARNAIQARGAAKTYLERYTATAILGMAAEGQDTDGQSAQWDKLDACLKAIHDAPDLTALNKIFKESYAEAKTARQSAALLSIADANDQRKKELWNEEPA